MSDMKCPHCGVEIGWGLPNQEAWERCQKGQLDLRGCVVPPPGTPIFCHYCGTYIGGCENTTPEQGRRDLEKLWREDRWQVEKLGFKSLDDIRRYFDPENHKPDQFYQHHREKQ